MVLVDSSVWIQLFRSGEPGLARLLEDGMVMTHPFVLGELSCGNLKDRALTLSYLRALPSVRPATHEEAFHLLEERGLFGRGLGWVDLQLLASALITGCGLWTMDKRLAAAAEIVGLPG